MARNKRKAKKSNIIKIIISIFAILTISALSVNNYLIIDKYTKKNKTLTTKLKEIKKEYSTLKDNTNVLKKELEKINNLDGEINNEKKEVFILASQLENKITKKETNYKIAYITFDDGPYYNTNKVLDILKKYKVKATFFTIGEDKDTCYDNRKESCAGMYKKIVDNGHTIANHTYSHGIFKGLYSNANSFITQIKKQETLIKDRTGATTNILRFPGGSSTANALCGYNCKENIIKELRNSGYGWVDWTAQDGDGGSLTDYNTGWRNLTGSINEDIEVILFHDYNGVTTSILPKAIEYLQSKNYIILPLFYESVKVNK